jgi:hypothetical protein
LPSEMRRADQHGHALRRDRLPSPSAPPSTPVRAIGYAASRVGLRGRLSSRRSVRAGRPGTATRRGLMSTNTRSPAPSSLFCLRHRGTRRIGEASGLPVASGMPWVRHRKGRGRRQATSDERSEPFCDCQVEPPETEHLSNRRTTPGPPVHRHLAQHERAAICHCQSMINFGNLT